MSSPRSGIIGRQRWVFNGFGHLKDKGDPGERRGGGGRAAMPFHRSGGGARGESAEEQCGGAQGWSYKVGRVGHGPP
jgi:hypothetical protein